MRHRLSFTTEFFYNESVSATCFGPNNGHNEYYNIQKHLEKKIIGYWHQVENIIKPLTLQSAFKLRCRVGKSMYRVRF